MRMVSTFSFWLACGALLAAGFGPRMADAAIAIAFDPETGKASAYNGSWDQNQSNRAALDNCGRGCRIVATGKGTCAAVVEAVSTGTYAWAVAYGSTTGAAANSAWHECRRKGGVNCKTAVAICD